MQNKKRELTVFDLGKVPPQNIYAEEVVLEAIINYKDAIYDVVNIIVPEDFYKTEHAEIYRAALNLYTDNKPIDIITIIDQLKINEKLDVIGGHYYIAQLSGKIGSAANVEAHAHIVAQCSFKRKLIEIGYTLQQESFEDSQDVETIILAADKKITDINQRMLGKNTSEDIGAIFKDVVGDLHDRAANVKNGVPPGIPTGLIPLNDIFGGWKPAYYVLAGRPAMGKTALALSFAKIAAMNKIPVTIFSMEMSKKRLVERYIIGSNQVESHKYKTGKFTDDELKRISNNTYIANLPIHIDDTPGISARYLKTKARLLHRQNKCGLMIIDYLQLMDVRKELNTTANREREISFISSTVLSIQKELNIPVIALSQLSRLVEQRPKKIPQLSDLRESGSIEQDADVVMFVYRPAYYKYDTDEFGNPTKGIGQIIIGKNRDGSVDTVGFKHNQSLTNIYDVSVNDDHTPVARNITEQQNVSDDVPF